MNRRAHRGDLSDSSSGEEDRHQMGMTSDGGSSESSIVDTRTRRVRVSVPDPQHSSDSDNDSEDDDIHSAYQRLKVEHEKLKNYCQELIAKHKAEIDARDAEIRRLKAQRSGDGGDQDNQKVDDLVDEVQRLLTEKVSMQTEISQLRFQLAGKGMSDVGTSNGREDFEAARSLALTKVELSEKDREIQSMRERFGALQDENERLRQGINMQAEQMAIPMDLGKQKKRKTWWGGKKKDKKSLTPPQPMMNQSFIMGDDTDFLTASAAQPRQSVSAIPHGSMSMPAQTANDPSSFMHQMHMQKMAQRWHEKVDTLNARVLELERDKARADAENNLLDKERRTLTEKLSRAEAIVDGLKSQQKILQDPDRIPSTKSLMLPLPHGGGSEAERWRTVVQIQEAALRKTAIQKEELERQLKTLSYVHGDSHNGLTPEREQIRSLKDELMTQAKLLADARLEAADLRTKVQEAKLRETYLVDEFQKAKAALHDMEELLRQKTTMQHKQRDTCVAMLGHALADNEILVEGKSNAERAHLLEIIAMHGEVRNLRQGRVGRMKGDAPAKPVFPSPPPGDMPVFRKTEDAKVYEPPIEHVMVESSTVSSRSTSSESSTISSGPEMPFPSRPMPAPGDNALPDPPKPVEHVPNHLSTRYYYQWTGGQYVLRECPPEMAAPVPLQPETERRPGPFPTDRGAGEAMLTNEEQERAAEIARAALRSWNAAPPTRPQAPPPAPDILEQEYQYVYPRRSIRKRHRRLSANAQPPVFIKEAHSPNAYFSTAVTRPMRSTEATIKSESQYEIPRRSHTVSNGPLLASSEPPLVTSEPPLVSNEPPAPKTGAIPPMSKEHLASQDNPAPKTGGGLPMSREHLASQDYPPPKTGGGHPMSREHPASQDYPALSEPPATESRSHSPRSHSRTLRDARSALHNSDTVANRRRHSATEEEARPLDKVDSSENRRRFSQQLQNVLRDGSFEQMLQFKTSNPIDDRLVAAQMADREALFGKRSEEIPPPTSQVTSSYNLINPSPRSQTTLGYSSSRSPKPSSARLDGGRPDTSVFTFAFPNAEDEGGRRLRIDDDFPRRIRIDSD